MKDKKSTQFRLTHKGVLARWVLENLTASPVAATALMDALEKVGIGTVFVEREAPGHTLADELAWTVNGLGGTADGIGRTKRRWLPDGEFSERRAARAILGQLTDSTMTATMKELVDAAKIDGVGREPFCRTAGWMLESSPRSDESEAIIERHFRNYWRRHLGRSKCH